MESYRLYVLNALNGKIDHERQFIAKDDETAVWISEGIRHTRPMELWHGASRVHRWESIALTAAKPVTTEDAPLPLVSMLVN